MTAMKEVSLASAFNPVSFLRGYKEASVQESAALTPEELEQKQAARELMQGAEGMLAVPTVMGGILGAMVARKKHRISGAMHGALMGAGAGVGAGVGAVGGAVGGAGLGTLIGGGAGGLMNLATETDAQSKRSEVDKLRKPYAVEREAARGLVSGAAAGAVTGTLAGAGLGGVAGGAGGFVLARKLSRMIRERNTDPFAKNPVEEA
jgi:hypothetical protein